MKLLSTLFSLLICLPVLGNDFAITLKDNSVIKIKLNEPQIILLTPYGQLKIPVKDIKDIKIGQKIGKELKEKINKAIENLNSNDFKNRDDATKFLMENGSFSYHIIKGMKFTNTEMEARQKIIITFLEKELSNYYLNLSKDDIITTKELVIPGQIINSEFSFENKFLGKQVIGIENVKTLISLVNVKSEFLLDAEKSINDWFDTGLSLESRLKTNIKAFGNIDLYPTEAGKYIVNANGYTQKGTNSDFMAGSVYGKVGEQGLPFLIGSEKTLINLKGRLYLKIAPSPWNNTCAGSYSVVVKSEE